MRRLPEGPREVVSTPIKEILPANLVRLDELSSNIAILNRQLEMGVRPSGVLISETVGKLKETTKPLAVRAPDLEMSLYGAQVAAEVKRQAISEVRQLTESIKDTDAKLRGELTALLQGKSADQVQGLHHYHGAVSTAMSRLEAIEKLAAENVPVEDPFHRPPDPGHADASGATDFHSMH
ncbi:hypothetical protein [Rhodoligotrophos defluvii]|uniref:hypothetical protein n=1 Tax=Rhodoligotrophos defluvii TaxID=2561934 RepID=UPI0010C98E2F|nr:hypothetical protein [Rhodoligotrophos defluvii]